MLRFVPVLFLAVACKGGTIDPFDPTVVAEVPGWISAEIDAQRDICAGSPLWNDGEVRAALTFFAGEYHLDGDSVAGHEFWVLIPDPDLAATGFQECTVVWDVLGNVGEPARAGDYSLSLGVTIDEEQTDCMEDVNGNPVYAGEENFTATYDVFEAGNTIQLFFESGAQLGTGESQGNVLSWISERNCIIL